MKRAKVLALLVGGGAVALACSGTSSFQAESVSPDGWSHSLTYTHTSPSTLTLNIVGPPKTKRGCVVGKDASGAILGGGPLLGGAFSGEFPGAVDTICVTIPAEGPCPPAYVPHDGPGAGTAIPGGAQHAQRGRYEILEGRPSTGELKHVVVEAFSLEEAHDLVAAFLADPLDVPKPEEVVSARMRLVEPVNATPGLDVFLLRTEALDAMELEVNGAWSASLGGGIAQAPHPRSRGLHVLQVSIPQDVLDVPTALDPSTHNTLAWTESAVGDPAVLPGRLELETE